MAWTSFGNVLTWSMSDSIFEQDEGLTTTLKEDVILRKIARYGIKAEII